VTAVPTEKKWKDSDLIPDRVRRFLFLRIEFDNKHPLFYNVPPTYIGLSMACKMQGPTDNIGMLLKIKMACSRQKDVCM
jgi:hypothetical protein